MSCSVVISTCDRGDLAVAAVESVLGNRYGDFDVTVVDQSADESTAAALEVYGIHPKFTFIRSKTRGLSVGRNIGIAASSGDVIALTDDDCRVAEDWLGEMTSAFAADNSVGIVFGNVLPGRQTSLNGFIPCYSRDAPQVTKSIYQKHRTGGMGACMGLRRDLWRRSRGFDPSLGAGGPYFAGEETDLVIRALIAGYGVVETPRISVLHDGCRTPEEGRALLYRYWFGTGASIAKNLKVHPVPILVLLIRLAQRLISGGGEGAIQLDGAGGRGRKMVAFARGMIVGLATPLDVDCCHFMRCKVEPE